MKKKTLIVGASTNPERYSFIAAQFLQAAGHPFELFGIKKGTVLGKIIKTEFPQDQDFDTVTLYISAKKQPDYYQAILDLRPKRIIFNPGTENPEFAKMANQNGIKTENVCTLVLINSNQY